MSEKKKSITKIDFKKEFKYLFSPSVEEPEIVEVPAFKYITIDGQGHPKTSVDFQDKVMVIYGLAYTIKFMLKLDKEDPYDFTVPPLSGLFDADDIAVFGDEERGDEWRWTMMIMLPDRVTNDIFDKAKEELRKKKNPRFLDNASLKIYEEGLSAQILYIGPYSEEGPTIKRLHDFFQKKGYSFNGCHHEIYLSDPRRSKPEKLKTIIRQPIKRKE